MSRNLTTAVSRALSHQSTSAAAPTATAANANLSRNWPSSSTPLTRPRASQARTLSTSTPSFASPITSRPSIPSEVVRLPSSTSGTHLDPDGADTESPLDTSSPQTAAEVAAEAAFVPPPLSSSHLSLLYSYTTPPPTSALSAFAARLDSATPAFDGAVSLAESLPLVEQTLIHSSFWDGVRSLQDQLSLSTSGTDLDRKFTNFHDLPLSDSSTTAPLHAHNGALATLGNALLGTFTAELVLQSFPNLPTRAAKAAITLYAGPKHLANVASSQWGVGPSRLEKALVGRDADGKVSRKERAYGHLVEGRGGAKRAGDEVGAREGSAGSGLVRWNRKASSPLASSILFEDALASVSRAVIGAVYTTHGLVAARHFIHTHFLSRLVPPTSTSLPSPSASQDLAPLLKFTQPSRVLSLSLQAHGLPALRHSLLKESGRLSAHPTFVTGAFSGAQKLGEGFGSSLKMAEWRASEDALRRVYLGGGRSKGLPSDKSAFEGWSQGAGFSEVEHETRR